MLKGQKKGETRLKLKSSSESKVTLIRKGEEVPAPKGYVRVPGGLKKVFAEGEANGPHKANLLPESSAEFMEQNERIFDMAKQKKREELIPGLKEKRVKDAILAIDIPSKEESKAMTATEIGKAASKAVAQYADAVEGDLEETEWVHDVRTLIRESLAGGDYMANLGALRMVRAHLNEKRIEKNPYSMGNQQRLIGVFSKENGNHPQHWDRGAGPTVDDLLKQVGFADYEVIE
jgi:hypothetical protein